MPRVTPEHLAARRTQIADAAQRCFARDGFHATSMHDVIAESGLSAGAVYRYFKGKEALVREIATRTVREVTGEFDQLVAADPLPPLAQVLDGLIAAGERYLEVQLRLAVQVWGEALRNPELAELVRGFYGEFRSRFAELARRAVQDGQLPPTADPEAVGSALFSLIPGYILQRLLIGGPDRDTYLAGIVAVLGATPRATLGGAGLGATAGSAFSRATGGDATP